MTRKTETLYASEILDGSDFESALKSFEEALRSLEQESALEQREVLYDTLEASIERITESNVWLSARPTRESTYSIINVSASAVKL